MAALQNVSIYQTTKQDKKKTQHVPPNGQRQCLGAGALNLVAGVDHRAARGAVDGQQDVVGADYTGRSSGRVHLEETECIETNDVSR